MIIHDGIYAWEGFGGLFNLAAGRCRLRIFNLGREGQTKVAQIKPYIIVVNDLPEENPAPKKVTVRSCCSHIATCVTQDFRIDPQRMIFVEYYPQSTYGQRGQNIIAAKYDAVDFSWRDGKALHPKWRALEEPLRSTIAELISRCEAEKQGAQ